MIKLYHGSTVDIDHIDLLKSRPVLSPLMLNTSSIETQSEVPQRDLNI
jgi:hypothetical protein